MCVYTGVYVHVCALRHGMGGGWTMLGGLLASKEQVTAMEAHHLLSIPDVHSPAAPGGHQGLSHPVPSVTGDVVLLCSWGWGQGIGTGRDSGRHCHPPAHTQPPVPCPICIPVPARWHCPGGCPRGSVTARSLPAIPTAPCCEATCLRVAGGVPTAPGVSPGLAAA